MALAATSVGSLMAAGCRCQRGSGPGPWIEPVRLPQRESAAVWIAADGMVPTDPRSEPMRAKAASSVELFGLRGETVAFQVVVQAGARALEQVSVDIERFELQSSAGEPPSPRELAVEVRRFVAYPLLMVRRSGGKIPGESLGWAPGAAPPGPPPGGSLDDPLIPVEVAPPWAAYPMRVEPGQHRTVWIDVAIPEQPVLPGRYHSTLRVTGRDTTRSPLAEIPILLEVGRPLLPYAPLRTMVYFEPATLRETLGSQTAVDQYQMLMHAHHLTTVMPINTRADVDANAPYLTGELFSGPHRYRGPGAGVAPDVVVLGAYGGLGDPGEESLRTVETVLDGLQALGVHDRPGTQDVFLYAIDEQCDSSRGADWKRWLARSSVPAVRALRVGHTCSEPPAQQAVDVVITAASSYRPAWVEAATRQAKHVWIYNGALPQTGAFLTDSWRVSLRANAWIQAAYGIERWFYWESAFWGDRNPGGHGAHDLFAGTETFHNRDGDWCNGDGVLVYPGRQALYPAHSAGYDGVFPSVRLKQWRRGLSDAGYLMLAREIDPALVARVARSVVAGALDHAKPGQPPLWPTTPEVYEAERRRLFELVRSRH